MVQTNSYSGVRSAIYALNALPGLIAWGLQFFVWQRDLPMPQSAGLGMAVLPLFFMATAFGLIVTASTLWSPVPRGIKVFVAATNLSFVVYFVQLVLRALIA